MEIGNADVYTLLAALVLALALEHGPERLVGWFHARTPDQKRLINTLLVLGLAGLASGLNCAFAHSCQLGSLAGVAREILDAALVFALSLATNQGAHRGVPRRKAQ